VTFFAAPQNATRLKGEFPRSLNGAPMLLPFDGTALRRSLDSWFHKMDIRPVIVGEFYDSALIKVFGEAGSGIFAAPSLIEEEIQRTYRVVPIGSTDEVEERFYAISADRKFKHPAVVAISEAARSDLFGQRS
jgi:LysR family transcriptional regulator, transcriptional activator of nhaA